MSYFKIEKALADKIAALALPCPVGKFGIPLTDEEKGNDLWVQPHNLPGTADPVTCGYNGEDNLQGILQLDLAYPSGGGSGKLLALADIIRTAFQAGDFASYDGVHVKFRSCSMSPITEVGGFEKRYISIVYYARIPRHT